MLALLAATVVLLSIDGLKPDYVLEADEHGLRIPHLRSLVADGVSAIDMRDIAPTLAPFLGVSLPSAEGHNLLEK